MGDNPKGIFDVIGSWFDPNVNNAVDDAEKSRLPGPTKKLNVVSIVLNLLLTQFGIGGFLAEIIKKLLGPFIDSIVGEKNASGEFQHKK